MPGISELYSTNAMNHINGWAKKPHKISRSNYERTLLCELDKAPFPIEWKMAWYNMILTSDTFDVLWIGAKQIHSLSNAAVARYIPDETLYAYSLDAYNEFIEEKSTSSPSIYLRSTPSQSASTYLGSTPVRATSTSMNSSETLHEEQSQYAEEVKREKAEPVTLKIEHDLATVERKDIEKVKAKKPATKGKAKASIKRTIKARVTKK